MVVSDTSAHTAVSMVVDSLHCVLLSNTHLPKVWVRFLPCKLQAGMASCRKCESESPGQIRAVRFGMMGGPFLRTCESMLAADSFQS